MRRCFLLANEVLERLTVDDSMVNIILGTGVLAREMQGKLQLLNLKAPLLIGFEDDSEKGVLGYENLDRLEESESCRFISCMDIDEFALIGPSHSAVRKLLGSALTNNPRFITFSSQPVIGERTPDLRTDVSVQSCRLRDGCPFTVDGDTGDKSAFKIHILGACTGMLTF